MTSAIKTKSQKKVFPARWGVPILLVMLSLIPVFAGSARLVELSSGAEITSDNARFFASPLPVIFHIVSVSLYSILGAFQFAPAAGFRRRRPYWHRAIGKLLLPCGFIAALSGLWMTHFYPRPVGDGVILYWLRIVFGSGMILSLVLGTRAIFQQDFARHGDWMTRAYAIGLGAGTQVLTHLPWFVLFGKPGEFPRAMLMGAAWVINLVVAEWVIRKRLPHPVQLGSLSKSSTDLSASINLHPLQQNRYSAQPRDTQ